MYQYAQCIRVSGLCPRNLRSSYRYGSWERYSMDDTRMLSRYNFTYFFYVSYHTLCHHNISGPRHKVLLKIYLIVLYFYLGFCQLTLFHRKSLLHWYILQTNEIMLPHKTISLPELAISSQHVFTPTMLFHTWCVTMQANSPCSPSRGQPVILARITQP